MVGGGVVVAPSYQEESEEPKPEKLDFYSLKLCFSWVQGERGTEREEHGWTLCDVTAREPRSQDIESRGEPRQQRVIERAGPAPKRKPRAPSASGSVGATRAHPELFYEEVRVRPQTAPYAPALK